MAFSWVPLHAREVAADNGCTDFAARPRRLQLLLEAYGHQGDPGAVLDAVQARIIDHMMGLRQLAATGDPPFVRLVQQGVFDNLQRALAQLDSARPDLLRHGDIPD